MSATIPAGRRGEGNPEVLEWCATCVENVVALRDGTCPWCDSPTGEPATASDEPVIPPRRDRRHNHGQARSDEQIIERVHLWARVMGTPPTKTDWDGPKLRRLAQRAADNLTAAVARVHRFETGDWPSEASVRERFGSVNAALVQAGYPPVPTGRPARTAAPQRRVGTGELALGRYFDAVRDARAAGDATRLRLALETLAISAMREADRLEPSS